MVDPQSYADSGSYFTPASITGRRRLYDAMLQQGLDTSPIRHWSQGLARLTQALIGGYKADEEERDSLEKLGITLGNSLQPPNLSTAGKPGTDTPAECRRPSRRTPSRSTRRSIASCRNSIATAA
jgi:hypothetical protein